MPKKFFKKISSQANSIVNNRSLRLFGDVLHSPFLWHLNRRSIARAFAIGLFITVLPVPIHMLLATASSIIFRANLPLAIALVWVNNPITMPAVFYFCYLLGAFILGRPIAWFDFSLPEAGILAGISSSFLPLTIGSVIVGTILATTSYCIINWLWRWHILYQWQNRRKEIPQIGG
ncbi:hypothetical protein TI04_02250 [Achromatium sp. WMS2]|nr:hypothetical protein TI04_02250 [Achromatium sp. WMS2]